MAITVAKDLHTTRDHTPFPGLAAAAITAPCALSVSATQNDASKAIRLEKTVAANREAYVGFNILADVAIGRQPTCLKDTIVEGFAGVTPGSKVYVADDGTLTHTATGNFAIGIGVRSTAIYFYAAPAPAPAA
jgi:homoaconitase/3-isopropylmalate dehydratase large subunit